MVTDHAQRFGSHLFATVGENERLLARDVSSKKAKSKRAEAQDGLWAGIA